MNVRNRLRVTPGRRVRLTDKSADATPGGGDKEQAEAALAKMLPELRKLQFRLFAEGRRAVLMLTQQLTPTRQQ